MTTKGDEPTAAGEIPPPPAPAPAMRISGSETLAKLIPAMIAARKVIGPVLKEHSNPAFPKSRYADLAAVREACAGPLLDNGLLMVQSPHFHGGDYYLKTTIFHTSGEWIACDYPAFCNYGEPQKIGSATTYARRYSLMALMDIAPEDDDGEAAMGRGPERGRQGGGRPPQRGPDRGPDRQQRPTDRGNDRPQRAPQGDPRRGGDDGATRGAASGPRESWADHVPPLLRDANERWRAEMEREGVDAARRADFKEVTNELRLINHLCTRLIETGVIQQADVAKTNDPTVRDGGKSRQVVQDKFARAPTRMKEAIDRYLAGKRAEARAQLGMVDQDDDGPGAAGPGGEPVEEAISN